MNIISHGIKQEENTKGLDVMFACKNCGCVYLAKPDEYDLHTYEISMTLPFKYNVYSNCPECHKMNSACLYKYGNGDTPYETADRYDPDDGK